VIFTLPHELHALWLWNRQLLTEVLFTSVRETLVTLLRDPRWLGAQPGILATLHPWSRTLVFHAPVHCLVSGGGLTVQGSWAAVRTLFRGKVLGAIEELWLTGRLQTPPTWEDDGVRQVLIEAARQKWNIRIVERYRHGRGVVKYLARYVRGGPIKDHRFVAFDGQAVTLRYGSHRERDERGAPRQQELTLKVAEFLRRWSAHVPRPGVHTARAWGLYASTQRSKLERCRAQLPEEEPLREPPSIKEEKPLRDHDRPWEECPVCQQRLVVIQVLARGGAPPGQSWAVAA
jgi:hypothetical protein